MPRYRFRARAIIFLVFAPVLAARVLAEVEIAPAAGAGFHDGDSPHLVVSGLKPGERVTVHAFRKVTAFNPPKYEAESVLAHAEAEFVADRVGTVAVDSQAPLRGSYSGIDPMGLLWSGVPMELRGSANESVTQGVVVGRTEDVVFRVVAPSVGSGHWVERQLRFVDDADSLEIQSVSLSGLNGVFARPKVRSSDALPAILLLHGSEGGNRDSARGSAIRFAQLGYAAFAVNYFAWPGTGISGVPQALVDVPVETLAKAREWLMQQRGVDAGQVAVWGVSKGAELALVGAAHYAWIDRVVACVPSSVVWEGFGRPPVAGEVYSSWSIDGKGLPYIPYDRYQDALDRKFSAAYVHRRSLTKATSEQRVAAQIPIEGTHAKLLLLAATNDVVWPSAMMTEEMEATLRAAHKADILHAEIYPNASHYICGTGSEPRRVNPVHKPEGDDPTPEADAHAAAESWKATKEFLRR